MVENKFAEWDNTSHTKLRLLLKSPEFLANEIYSWASTEGFLGNVFTIYELHSGEQYKNTGTIKPQIIEIIPLNYFICFQRIF